LKQLDLEWNELAKSKLNPLMTQEALLETAILLGLNVNIVRDNVCDSYIWNEKDKHIDFQILSLGGTEHACLCDIEFKNQLPIGNVVKGMMDLTSRALSLIQLDSSVDTAEAQKFATDGDVNHLILNEPLKSKILHTMNSTNLAARSGRTSNPLQLVNVLCKNKFVCQLDYCEMAPGKLLGVLATNGWMYGLLLKDLNGDVLLVTERTVEINYLVLVDVGCRILEPVSATTRHVAEVDAKPLNITTLNHLRKSTSTIPYSSKLADKNSKEVLIFQYDNRSHDKYDEKTIIDNSTAIWVGEQLNTAQLDKLSETYDKKIRYVYSRGKFSLQFDDLTYGGQWLITAYAIERKLEYYRNVGLLVVGEPLSLDKANLDTFLAAADMPDLVDGKLLKLTESEWKKMLGVYGSAFDEMSSRTFTQQDDLYVGKVIKELVGVPVRGMWDVICSQSYYYLTRTTFFAAKVKVWITKPSAGGEEFALEEKISLGNSKDWWKKIGLNETILKDLEPNPLVDVMTNPDIELNSYNWSNRASFAGAHMDECQDEELNFNINSVSVEETFEQVVPHEIQNMWINTDLSMDLRQYAPINAGRIRSKENPDQIRITNKVTMNEPTPMESRPVLTKWTFEEHRSITGRLFSKIKYRNPIKTKSVKTQVKDFIDLYFDETFVPYTGASQILDVDPFETMQWISKRRDGLRIAQELNDLLTHELGMVPLNAINIHLKLESLMKENPINHWGQHQARAIYWQRKAIAAISSPVFLKVKTRLKNSLRNKYVYADGLTPGELNQKARNKTNVNWFFENDLSKQDRQTDKPLIDVEMELYLILGVSPSMITWWRTMHENWKFRARWNKGYAKEMRLTGQSTTALGNLITNMQVHLEFLKRNDSKVKLTFFLGDDILVMLSDKPDVSWLEKFTKQSHNMKSTQRLSDKSGLFCCMIAYRNPYGGAEIGPDYVRLRYRFEVTNGVSEANPENVINRCQSYACMVGKTDEMQSIKLNKLWTIPLEDWYDGYGLVPAIMDRYELDEYTVMNNYKKLCGYIENPKPLNVEFSTYTNVKVY
jgi:2-polyprenyl-3-methyl-5-hydroxy-6-metoxy-1,4-benzoquinol methylase